jgi:hypothetical protein
MGHTTLMTLPDGRELAWLDIGDPAGPVVFGFQGTPGSRNQIAFLDDVIAQPGCG